MKKRFTIIVTILATGAVIWGCASRAEQRRQKALQIEVSKNIEALKNPDSEVRLNACLALESIGPPAEPAIPALVELLKDSDTGVLKCASRTLGNIGPAAIPVLIEASKNPDPNVRRGAAWGLSRIGKTDKSVIPSLIQLAKDPDIDVRGATAWGLGEIGKVDKTFIPTLIELVRDPDKRPWRGAVPVDNRSVCESQGYPGADCSFACFVAKRGI